MEKIDLSGLGTALVTPFKDGQVDYGAFGTLVERQIAAGVDFLVPLGTTGETPCLDEDEKIRILEITADKASGARGRGQASAVAGANDAGAAGEAGAKGSEAVSGAGSRRVPVVAGVGTNSLKTTLANIRLLEGHGVDAFLVVVPYYNKPTQRGQYEYFKAVAEQTDKPVIVYNVPGRTGANMQAETTLRLAEIDNIVAVKEASGNLEQIYTILKAAPQGFAVLSGNDDQTFDIMKAGGAGVISVASNLAPDLMVRFVAAIRSAAVRDAARSIAIRDVAASDTAARDAARSTANSAAARSAANSAAVRDAAAREEWTEAERLNGCLMPLFKGCFIESNPIPVKAALSALGLISNELRLPLTSCEPSTMKAMQEIITKYDIRHE